MAKQIMTAAEFAASREHMQIPVSHLAEKWEVHRQSVNRWEHGYRDIPEGIQEGMSNLVEEYQKIVDGLVADYEAMPQNIRIIFVEPGDGLLSTDKAMPRSMWRAIAFDVARRTGARIEYR